MLASPCFSTFKFINHDCTSKQKQNITKDYIAILKGIFIKLIISKFWR